MPVAEQATPFLIGLGLLAAVLGIVLGYWFALPVVVLALFVIFFFRDPERVSPLGEGLVLSPADGRVTAVERRPEGARVTIFLSLFNCHINRSPVAGTVAEVRYTPGRFLAAWNPAAGAVNERNELRIETRDGVYGVTQVAGVLARRIVCTKKRGDEVRAGERIGLIQFGSRTDLDLPFSLEPQVRVGDAVRGGLTVIARREAPARRAVGGE
jgi:phosphatidylserine decarboxylase